METPIQVDLGRIAQDLQIRRVQVESVVQLLDESNTVPFITRYRKERTGGLDERVIREIQSRVIRQRELAERKETILKSIEQQGKLNDELREAILGADSPKRLEDLYLPFKPKKKTRASEAREKGLEPLALRIWNRDETLADLNTAAQEFLNPEKGVETVEQVLEGVGHILAESINELAPVRDSVRRIVWRAGKVLTNKADNIAEGQGLDFRDYFQYSEPVNHVPPHRVLAINRGDKENVLKVKLEVPRQDLERALFTQLPLEGHPHQEFFTHAALDALDRLLLPSLEREVRRDLTDMAERHAVDVFARNLRSLLLQPPIAHQTVLAIDPGFRTGCKVAVLDEFGKILEHDVIHPHQPQNRRHDAKQKLKELVVKHNVGVVAIGNGTACRETEELVAELIAEGTYFHQNPDASEYPGAPPGSAVSAPEVPATEATSQDDPSSDTQHNTPQGRMDNEAPTAEAAESPSQTVPEGDAGSIPAPDAANQESDSPAEASPEPAQLTEGSAQEDPAPDAQHSTPQGRTDNQPDQAGDHAPKPSSESDQETEAMPPIRGGAPDEPENSEPTAQEQAPGETPIETTPPPPPSSTPEAESGDAEAQKADHLESSESTRNPAQFGQGGKPEPEFPPSSSDAGRPPRPTR